MSEINLKKKLSEIKNAIEQMISANQLKDAKIYLTKYEKLLGTTDLDIYTMKAVIDIIELKFDSAERILMEGIIIESNYFDILYNLGYLNLIQKKLELSAYFFEKAILLCGDTNMINTIKGFLIGIQRELQLSPTASLKMTKESNSSFLEILIYEILENNKDKYVYNIDIELFQIMGEPLVDALMVDPPQEKRAVLENIDGLNKLYKGLSDQYSKNLLLKLICFRVLGSKKIKLPLNQPSYWQGRKQVLDLISIDETIPVKFKKLTLNYFDLNQIGYNLKMFLTSFGICATFLVKQYEYEYSNTVIKPRSGDAVIDAGGCWGDTALYFAHQVGSSGKVYSFEFIPSNIEIMKRNIELNSQFKEQIHIVTQPIWNLSNEIMYFEDEGPASRIYDSNPNNNYEKVKTTTIDDFVSSNDIPKIDFIKMDIEGAELNAIIGAKKTIQLFKPRMAIAVYHKLADFSEIFEYILQIDQDYMFYLGHYTITAQETVLFAVHKNDLLGIEGGSTQYDMGVKPPTDSKFKETKNIEMVNNLKSAIISPKNRRLAVIDTRFPWLISGFRYWENMEIYKQRPDTLFFATEPYGDYFPTQVHSFTDFKSIAISQGITDIYCVFLNLTLSLLGETRLANGMPMPGSISSLNLKPFLDEHHIKLHTTIYPGGGLDPTTPIEFFNPIENYCSTIFSNVKEVLSNIPKSIYTPVPINTDYYSYKGRLAAKPIQMVFCAHNAIRKGFPILISAFNTLDDDFHLHIIGPWEDQLHLLSNKNYTFHAVLPPEKIRSIYSNSQVFISCSHQDQFATDGFPTTAATEALSTGCILVTTNFRNDQFLLQSNVHYLEIDGRDYLSLVNALRWVKDNMEQAIEIGIQGAKKVVLSYDAKQVVEKKLNFIMQ